MDCILINVEGEFVVIVIWDLMDMKVKVRSYQQRDTTKSLVMVGFLDCISVKLILIGCESPTDKKGFS